MRDRPIAGFDVAIEEDDVPLSALPVVADPTGTKRATAFRRGGG